MTSILSKYRNWANAAIVRFVIDEIAPDTETIHNAAPCGSPAEMFFLGGKPITYTPELFGRGRLQNEDFTGTYQTVDMDQWDFLDRFHTGEGIQLTTILVGHAGDATTSRIGHFAARSSQGDNWWFNHNEGAGTGTINIRRRYQNAVTVNAYQNVNYCAIARLRSDGRMSIDAINLDTGEIDPGDTATPPTGNASISGLSAFGGCTGFQAFLHMPIFIPDQNIPDILRNPWDFLDSPKRRVFSTTAPPPPGGQAADGSRAGDMAGVILTCVGSASDKSLAGDTAQARQQLSGQLSDGSRGSDMAQGAIRIPATASDGTLASDVASADITGLIGGQAADGSRGGDAAQAVQRLLCQAEGKTLAGDEAVALIVDRDVVSLDGSLAADAANATVIPVGGTGARGGAEYRLPPVSEYRLPPVTEHRLPL